MQKAPSDPDPTPQTAARPRRGRGFHRSGKAWVVSLLLLLAFLSFVSFLSFGALMFIKGDRSLGLPSLVCLAVFVITRTLAFFWSRDITCPLCHGTILAERRCRKHELARKLPLLSYKATTVLGIVFTLGFRCMYCGTAYRLWKR
jgi:hypothetical protein